MNRLALKRKLRAEAATKGKKGQATTELAIMGTIVLMALAYLLQQGYVYNARQALEMYAFREALKLSRAQERGISLTVSRDVITPSFFSGLSRQRLTASSSVEVNPWKVYVPQDDDSADVTSYQLVQINEAMIREGKFILIPPTKVQVKSEDEDSRWLWISSSVREIDPQVPPEGKEQSSSFKNISNYTYLTSTSEDSQVKTISKDLKTQDTLEREITFENKDKTISDYNRNSTDSTMEDLEETTIPRRIKFTLSEQVLKQKTTTTPHNLGGGDNE